MNQPRINPIKSMVTSRFPEVIMSTLRSLVSMVPVVTMLVSANPSQSQKAVVRPSSMPVVPVLLEA